MTGLRHMQRGVLAFALAMFLSLQLGAALAAFNGVGFAPNANGPSIVAIQVECEDNTCG